MASSQGNAAMQAYWQDDFVPLEAAGKAVLTALRRDEAAPDADLYRRIVSSGSGSHLYFPSDVKSPGATLTHSRSIPLPPYLAQQLQTTRVSSLMGLLPEADLVWMSVDEKLFILSSNTSTIPGGMEDFCSFMVPTGQAVVSVGLVRPKKGVFQEMVDWCLVVTTPEEVILCALARSDSGSGGGSENGFMHRQGTLRLIPTRYILPTDSIPLLSVCGTPDGRIFLGGYDGCIYEMTYDSVMEPAPVSFNLEQRMNAFYDGEKPFSGTVGNSHNSVTHTLTKYGKRAISSIIPSSSDPEKLPRKCRKLNHSAHASSVVGAVVPSFLSKAASAIFGDGSSTSGGPIVKIVLDSERSCMYTLSSRGWISAYDLRHLGGKSNEIKLMAAIDMEKTARLYLEAVSRGRMYPPASSHSSSIGNITFPGGGSSAQAGVGGMDGARTILKLADSGPKRDDVRRRGSHPRHSCGILTPISIHVIPRSESGRLTLVAITNGGLRYYLSSLSTNVLNSGPGQQQTGSIRSPDPLAPSRKFTLCHVRSPPPIDDSGTVQDTTFFDVDASGVEGYVPRVGVSVGVRRNRIPHVDAGYYGKGVMVLALEQIAAPTNSSSSSGGSRTEHPSFVGDAIIAVAPDAVMRKKEPPPSNLPNGQPQQSQPQPPVLTAPGGISETLALPLVASASSARDLVPVLPGGRILDIAALPSGNSVLTLTLHSQTPSDSELGVGLVPAYFPPSRLKLQDEKQPGRDTPRTPLDAARASTGSGVIVQANGGGFGSVALTLISNFLLSRPLGHGLTVQRPLGQLQGLGVNEKQIGPLYRLSNRYGYAGFSTTAVDNMTRDKPSRRSATKAGSKSARLGSWLLRPAVAALNPFATQHLIPSSEMVALNSGGMHFFTYKSVLSILAEILMSASVNVGSDEAVTKFFINYGYAQGCSMCLSLAIGCGPAAYSDELQNRARRAALSRAFVPKLVRKVEHFQDPSGARDMSSSDKNAEIPPGYEFHSSALADGLTALTSRLLRPVWCKPAVVVTEGQTIRLRSGHEKALPAKVELLLDDLTLEEIRKPLHSLQLFMREVFVPAIGVVPGMQRQVSDRMDVEEMNGSGGSTLTDAMRFHGYVRGQTQYGTGSRLTPEDAGAMAKLMEERNLHSLYRLVSRSVQLLSLLSFLKRAQYLPELHGVEWGLLHGLTIAQLVQMRDCQERIDRLLSSLVSPSSSSPVSNVSPSAESDQLATLLASECYLYFSPGSHYAYMGFRSAGEAMSCAPSSARRAALTNQTAEYLKRAACHWYSAPLITGRILHGQENESYEQTALRAMRFDSPLAKAAAVLFQLQDVVGIVDVCLTAASNFGGRHKKQEPPGSPGSIFDSGSEMLPWERVLYHKRRHVQEGNRGQNGSTTPSSPTSALVLGADVTPKDALSTCHAILFHYLSTLLDSPNTELARKMIEACAESPDKEFLHSLYDHLVRTKRFGALLQISSSDLETWLGRPGMDVELLWQYYRGQGKDAQAGEVMRKHACETKPDLDIDVRINLLRKALSSFAVALQKNSDNGRGYAATGWSRPLLSEADREALQLIYTEVSETLDVAVLQSRILRTVASSSLESKLDEQQISRLKSTLIPVSDLYNEYAAPLNLSDFCLLILHSCRHSDASTIETLWRNVVCEEIFPCATHSVDAYQFLQSLMAGSVVDESITLLAEGRTPSLPLFEDADWVLTLQDRIVSLGKEVYGNGADYVFPIDFLVSTLEGLRHALLSSKSRVVSMSGRGKPWPLQILVQVGVPFSASFEAYENLAVREERELMGGIEAQRRLLHIFSTVEVLSEWVVAASASTRGDGTENYALKELSRAVSSGVLMSRIDSFKAALEGLGAPDEDARDLLDRLSRIEEAIMRIA